MPRVETSRWVVPSVFLAAACIAVLVLALGDHPTITPRGLRANMLLQLRQLVHVEPTQLREVYRDTAAAAADRALSDDAWDAWGRLKAGKGIEPHTGTVHESPSNDVLPASVTSWRPARPLNESQFAALATTQPWATLTTANLTRYSRADLETMWKTSPIAANLMLVTVGNGTARWSIWNAAVQNVLGGTAADLQHQFHGHFPPAAWRLQAVQETTEFFEDVAQLAPQLSGSVIVNLDDGASCKGYANVSVPVLTYNKCDSTQQCPWLVNMPDLHFTTSHGYTTNPRPIRHKVRAAAIRRPWAKKLNKAMWRGHGNSNPVCPVAGNVTTDEVVKCYQRVHAAYIGKNDPTLFDVKIVNPKQQLHAWDASQPSVAAKKYGLWGRYCDFECELDAKLQLDIDGTANAWDGFFWKLLSNSAVIKVASPYGCTQWFYPRLHDGEHFIGVPHVEALPAAVRAALADDAMLRNIAESGTRFANELTYHSEVLYSAALLRNIFELQRS